MTRIVIVIAFAAALGGCVRIEKKPESDGSICQKFSMPLVRWESCNPAPAPAPAPPSADK